MSNIQPLLVSRKGTTSDLSLMLSSDSTQIFVFLGTSLLERINASPAELQYKLMVGRMVNANHRMADLRRCFGHDPRTMSQWGVPEMGIAVKRLVRPELNEQSRI